MSIECGSQALICDVPVRLDSYDGCSHACTYCFVKHKTDIKLVKANNCIKQLESFIKGERSKNFEWCDWKIPLYWGGMSDPFQPAELLHKVSLKMMDVFIEHQYPVLISTKGSSVLARDEYLNKLKEMNAAVQISALCSEYDKIELGAPTFEQRMIDAKKISQNCKRLIIRCQPYHISIFGSVLKNIKNFKEAGAHGVIFEGMKYKVKKPNTEKHFGDFVFSKDILQKQFQVLKEECHKYDLKFYSGENRLRSMGDDLCCCGIADIDGFKVNKGNFNHLILGKDAEFSKGQEEKKAGDITASLMQSTIGRRIGNSTTYKEFIEMASKTNFSKVVS